MAQAINSVVNVSPPIVFWGEDNIHVVCHLAGMKPGEQGRVLRRSAIRCPLRACCAAHANHCLQLVIHQPQLVKLISQEMHIACFSARQDNFYVIRLTIIQLDLTLKNRRNCFACRNVSRKRSTATKRSQ